MTAYPPGLTTGHDRAVWDLLMADHFCTVVSQWSQERQVVVDRCFCGREWWLPRRQVGAPLLALPAGTVPAVAA